MDALGMQPLVDEIDDFDDLISKFNATPFKGPDKPALKLSGSYTR